MSLATSAVAAGFFVTLLTLGVLTGPRQEAPAITGATPSAAAVPTPDTPETPRALEVDDIPSMLDGYAARSVAPGVWRVDADGVGRDPRQWDLVVTSAGDIFAKQDRGTGREPRQVLVRLGQSGQLPIPGRLEHESAFGILVHPDGTLVAGCGCDLGTEMYRYVRGRWTDVPSTADWTVRFGARRERVARRPR